MIVSRQLCGHSLVESMCFLTILLLNWQCVSNCVQWNLRTKETSLNKRNLSIMNRIACPKTSLSYSANTFITSEERKPLYNEQNNLSQKLRYSEVPLYLVEKVANNSLTQVVRPLSYKKANIYVVRVCVIEK